MRCPKCHTGIRLTEVDPFQGFEHPVLAVLRRVVSAVGLFECLAIVSQDLCPHCGVKVYVIDNWRHVRALACVALAISLSYRWFPSPECCGTSEAELWVGLFCAWFVALGTLAVWLLSVSTRLLPLHLDLVPQDGPLRLDL
jgi:hypothetical protein